MRILFIFAILVIAASSAGEESDSLPSEGQDFVRNYDLCDHFRVM